MKANEFIRIVHREGVGRVSGGYSVHSDNGISVMWFRKYFTALLMVMPRYMLSHSSSNPDVV
jgi:hypothetical protein